MTPSEKQVVYPLAQTPGCDYLLIMDRGNILRALFVFVLGWAGWAAAEIAAGHASLPYFVLSLSAGAMLIIGPLIYYDWRKAHRRVALPGFGVHMAIRVSDIRHSRRQYIFEVGKPGEPGASFYLSASRRFVFCVRDASGEPYPLEIAAGWLGFPIADAAYFGLEAGTDGSTTIMRAIVNGRVLAERKLPFAVDFSGLTMTDLTVGASSDRTENGGFALNNLAFVATTLSSDDAGKMAQFMATRTGVGAQ